MDAYETVWNDDSRIIWIPARDIEYVFIDQNELENFDGFWTRYRDNDYTMETMQEKARKLNQIYQQMANGRQIQDLVDDPDLGDAAGSYLADVISVMQVENFYVFYLQGRHRILGAQSIDAMIPVHIKGTYKKFH